MLTSPTPNGWRLWKCGRVGHPSSTFLFIQNTSVCKPCTTVFIAEDEDNAPTRRSETFSMVDGRISSFILFCVINMLFEYFAHRASAKQKPITSSILSPLIRGRLFSEREPLFEDRNQFGSSPLARQGDVQERISSCCFYDVDNLLLFSCMLLLTKV